MISKVTKSTLRKASRKSVGDTLEFVKAHLRKQKWLGTTNRYRTRCTEFLFRDTQPGHLVNSRNLAQYIVASAPLHCAEGWSVLGRALDCHGRADFEASRHLAYYAELRAALSLLAAEGIGIFDDRHFIVDSPTNCQLVPRPRRGRFGTHFFAWAALEHWADLKRSADLLGKIITSAGSQLVDWIQNFGTGPAFHPIGSRWLKTWGLDLQRLSDDRKARNEASYRPRFDARNSADPNATSEFMWSIWSLCEPTAGSRFETLDRHLIRLTLEEVFKGTTGTSAQADRVTFSGMIDAMLGRLGFNTAKQEEWQRFLTRNVSAQDPTVLQAARLVTDIHHPQYHLQVISRATLLLRVASGACDGLLREADLGKDQLMFWWKALGEKRGLWDSGNEPEEIVDLWGDVDGAISKIQQWHAEHGATNPSFEQWRRDSAHEISVLGECERIGLWGLGL